MATDSVPLSPEERRKQRRRAYYQRKKAARRAYGNAYYATHKGERAEYYQLKKAGLWIPRPKRPKRPKRATRPRSVPIGLLSPEAQARRRQKDREYWDRNKEQRNARRRERTASGAYKRPYHAEKDIERVKRRRAQKLTSTAATLTEAQWREILERCNYQCVYCLKGLKATRRIYMHDVTQDHLTPLKHHGPHTVQNVLPACRSCNAKKGTGAVLCPVQPFLLTVA